MNNETPFHRTGFGRQLLEQQVPQLIRLIAELTKQVARLADALEERGKRERDDSGSPSSSTPTPDAAPGTCSPPSPI